MSTEAQLLHPLDPLSKEEMEAAASIVRESEHFGPKMRFATII